MWNVSGVESATCALRGVPMLPPTTALKPPAVNMRPASVVVVDFPFVPVIATMRPVSQRDASSTSPITGMPALRAAATCGWVSGTPGLNTIKSALSKVSDRCSPSSRAMPASRRRCSSSVRSSLGRRSVSVTRAPRSASSSAAATPLRAPPTTVTFWPSTENGRAAPLCAFCSLLLSMSLTQLQRRQAEQREDDSQNQKPGDHFRFAPADQLEVMMERRHLEHALAGHLERCHLDNHRQRFEHEHAADNRQ